MVYRPANQLFSDYAQKLRTIWIPEGSKAQLVGDELSYPVGTVVSKTFYYPTDSAGNLQRTEEVIAETIDLSASQLIETRLLVKRSAGWEAFPYVWNDEGSEAFLRVAGTSKAFEEKTNMAAQNSSILSLMKINAQDVTSPSTLTAKCIRSVQWQLSSPLRSPIPIMSAAHSWMKCLPGDGWTLRQTSLRRLA